MNKLARLFPSQIAPVREGGASSSTDVAQQFPDLTEIGKTSKGKLRNRDECIARRKKEFDQMEAFSVIHRVQKSEAIDGTHVRMKDIASENGDFVR